MACSIVTVRFVTGGVETQTQRKHSANTAQTQSNRICITGMQRIMRVPISPNEKMGTRIMRL